MINERYLEYLALDSIMQGYVSAEYFNDYYYEECYLLNNHMKIDINKVKKRIIELQKEFLKDYVLDTDSKE